MIKAFYDICCKKCGIWANCFLDSKSECVKFMNKNGWKNHICPDCLNKSKNNIKE